jgi:hypothetical protein
VTRHVDAALAGGSSGSSSGLDVASLTPDQLGTLPVAARDAVTSAVVAGSSAMFWVAAAGALAAVVAALLIPRVARTPAAPVTPAT